MYFQGNNTETEIAQLIICGYALNIIIVFLVLYCNITNTHSFFTWGLMEIPKLQKKPNITEYTLLFNNLGH